MNTPGYISSRLTPRGQPCDETRASRCAPIWVQNFDPDDHAQSEYIRHLRISATQCTWPDTDKKQCKDGHGHGHDSRVTPYSTSSGKNSCVAPCAAASYYIGGKKFYRAPFTKSLPRLAMSCGEYVGSRLMVVKSLPTPPTAAPWPPKLARDAQCKSVLVTPQEGYRAGLLPEEWTNGGRTSMAMVVWKESKIGNRTKEKEEAKAWARNRFRKHAPAPAPAPLPPPPPPQQAPRRHDSPVPVCRRRPGSNTHTWYYTPGTNPTVPVGGSCVPGIIRAKARRAAGVMKPVPTFVFRNPT